MVSCSKILPQKVEWNGKFDINFLKVHTIVTIEMKISKGCFSNGLFSTSIFGSFPADQCSVLLLTQLEITENFKTVAQFYDWVY